MLDDSVDKILLGTGKIKTMPICSTLHCVSIFSWPAACWDSQDGESRG